MPPTPAVAVDHVDVAYPKSPAVLKDVHLTVPAGEHVAVIGRSGCGKSTLLHLIGGLLAPTRGSVAVLGDSDDRSRLTHCALMPQGDSLLPWFSVRDNVALPLRNTGVGRRAARARATEALAWCGLEHHSRQRPDRLSGGMRQRAALARALLADKPVLLADEPLGALDAITRAEIQDWLHGVLEGGSATTMVMVTHDVDEALLLSHRVVLLADGQVRRTWPGWFARRGGRPREDVLAEPGFAAARSALLRELAGGGR
ncbi:ABC transporter ATP-binding protein [Corynebacterium sp.]|jgi:ABC-type nitrate/sulfonate/bicarbonate transport system ATPase subunit|uniref:ABC transporter ATP-binding protein n=1 Tax=Corynebacterium sp. TaxID=1720 RepID=UPI0025B85304|nr:ABC transporter ATP-binding protein [Corynebacterium sp.]